MAGKPLIFDTSYLVRLYLDEVGCEAVRDLACTMDAISVAWHGQVEVIAAFHRIYRENRISRQRHLELIDQFLADDSNSLFYWLELNEGVRLRLLSFFRKASPATFLRAADALHLASAAEHGFTEIYSNDRHLLTAAPLFGLQGINVISEKS